MICSRNSYASGDACEATRARRPCVRCVAPHSHSECAGFFFLAHAFADRRHGTRKAVRAGRENDRPLRVARRVGSRGFSGGRVRLPRDRTVRRAVQSIFQTRRRRSVARNVVQVRFLHVHVQFLAISKRTISFFFADLSRENGQIPKLPIRSQTCLRCSQHGVTVR